jgi:hypothetical protein
MTRRLLISTSFVLVWCALFVSRASTSPGRVALQGSAPPWARSANLVSQTPANQEVIFRVYLPWRNATAAAV